MDVGPAGATELVRGSVQVNGRRWRGSAAGHAVVLLRDRLREVAWVDRWADWGCFVWFITISIIIIIISVFLLEAPPVAAVALSSVNAHYRNTVFVSSLIHLPVKTFSEKLLKERSRQEREPLYENYKVLDQTEVQPLTQEEARTAAVPVEK